jgi:hypothetical protein
MGGAKRQLEEEMAKADEEYRLESICPACGAEREEITLDHNTFWVCYICDTDRDDLEEDNDMPPEEDDLWAIPASSSSPPATDVVMVPVPRALAKDVVQAVAERIWYHVDGLKDNPLDDKCLADVNELTAFVKKLQKLFPEVDVEF